VIGVVGLICLPEDGATVTTATGLASGEDGADGELGALELAPPEDEAGPVTLGEAVVLGEPFVFVPVVQALSTQAKTAAPAAIIRNLPLRIPGTPFRTRSFCLMVRRPTATTRPTHQ
jgi:hypothetical protein